MIIREFTIDDYQAAIAIWTHIKTPDSPQEIERFLLRNPGLSLVACEDGENGEVIGTILCGHDCRVAWLYRVAVAETHRRQGVGNSLVREALKRLKGEGLNTVKLFARKENDIGNTFWRQLGFDENDTITRSITL